MGNMQIYGIKATSNHATIASVDRHEPAAHSQMIDEGSFHWLPPAVYCYSKSWLLRLSQDVPVVSVLFLSWLRQLY